MQPLKLSGIENILCLGAHSDDLEIGCGGTVLTLVKRFPKARWRWIVFSAGGPRHAEAQAGANAFLAGAAQKQITLLDHRDGFFPYEGGRIKEAFEEFKTQEQPDLIFTHYGAELHQDHRLLVELTWNTFRDHQILEYEIPKYDGGLGSPNVFMPLEPSVRQRKVDLLLKHFPTQAGKPWFSKELFDGLMCLRGMECNAPDRYAEAFYARKLRLA